MADLHDDNIRVFNDYKLDADGRLVFTGEVIESVVADNSIGEERKVAPKKVKKSYGAGDKFKSFVAGALTAVTILGAGFLTKEVKEKIDYYADSKTAIASAEEIMTDRLVENGCAVVSDDGTVTIRENLSSEDLSKLDIDGPVEVYVLNGLSDEIGGYEKIVQTATYSPGYNYVDFSQFLNINGFYDKDGKGDRWVFENICRDELVTAYRDGKLESIFADELSKGGINK